MFSNSHFKKNKCLAKAITPATNFLHTVYLSRTKEVTSKLNCFQNLEKNIAKSRCWQYMYVAETYPYWYINTYRHDNKRNLPPSNCRK